MFAQPSWPAVRPPSCQAGQPNLAQQVSYPCPLRGSRCPTRAVIVRVAAMRLLPAPRTRRFSRVPTEKRPRHQPCVHPPGSDAPFLSMRVPAIRLTDAAPIRPHRALGPCVPACRDTRALSRSRARPARPSRRTVRRRSPMPGSLYLRDAIHAPRPRRDRARPAPRGRRVVGRPCRHRGRSPGARPGSRARAGMARCTGGRRTRGGSVHAVAIPHGSRARVLVCARRRQADRPLAARRRPRLPALPAGSARVGDQRTRTRA